MGRNWPEIVKRVYKFWMHYESKKLHLKHDKRFIWPSFFYPQETFDAGLQAFQQEGITNITALKDQLLAAKHVQSKAIEARHATLMKRWNQLLSNSAARKKKLLEAQEHFRKVRRTQICLKEDHLFGLSLTLVLLFTAPFRWKIFSSRLPRKLQPSTAGLRTQRKIWPILWGATLWRRSGHCGTPMMPSARPWAPQRQTSASWQNSIGRLRATTWCPTHTPGSPWRLWRRPGVTFRRSSRWGGISLCVWSRTMCLLIDVMILAF